MTRPPPDIVSPAPSLGRRTGSRLRRLLATTLVGFAVVPPAIAQTIGASSATRSADPASRPAESPFQREPVRTGAQAIEPPRNEPSGAALAAAGGAGPELRPWIRTLQFRVIDIGK
jgi:hypothetical protein